MCRLVVLRHFISENTERITSDKKKGSKKANISLFFSPFHVIGPVLPPREPFPAHLSQAPWGVLLLVISHSPTGSSRFSVFPGDGCFPPFQVAPLPTGPS